MIGTCANADRSWADASERSASTQPTLIELLPPVKIAPNRKMKMSGNISVQKTACRLRR